MDLKTEQRLIESAKETASKAYAPYSSFRVGAALLDSEGKIWTGCNVENRSFGLTNCAERSAIYKAVSEGVHKFSAVAVVCLDSENPVPPCGACRQVLTEFMDSKGEVVFCGSNGTCLRATLGELYPCDSLHELNRSTK